MERSPIALFEMLGKFKMNLRFSSWNMSFGRGLFLAFWLGFFVRLIPEVLSFPYPIGFDTVYYAWRIKTGVVWYNWSQVFSTWLLYGILAPVYNVVRGDPFLLLKLTASLLFGLNTCGVFYFTTKALGWTVKKGLFTALLFSFQIAALAISWDFYRNILGLGILLFALPWIKNGVNNVKEFAVFALLSMLVVFSHEYGSVILIAAVLGVTLSGFLKGERRGAVKTLFASLPALGLFLVNVYFMFFPVRYVIEANVIRVYQTAGHYRAPFFFFTNYLTVYDSVQYYPTYAALVSHELSLFALLYLVVLPLVLIGFFRDKVVDAWVILLLVGGFGALITPFFALNLWSRWMLMLVYPFSFYAVNGVTKVPHCSHLSVSSAFRGFSWRKVSERAVKISLVLSLSFGLVFMATPLFFGRAGVFGFPTTVSYVPSTMQSNSLPLLDVDGTIKAMRWLDLHMNSSSALLSQEAFFRWAQLYLGAHMIVYFENDAKGAIDVALQHGFTYLYFVWWNENIGWYGLTVPSYFVSVFSSGRISVFEYSK